MDEKETLKALRLLYEQKLSPDEFMDKYRMKMAVRKRKRKRSKTPVLTRKRVKKNAVPSARRLQKNRALAKTKSVEKPPVQLQHSIVNLLTTSKPTLLVEHKQTQLFNIDTMERKHYIHHQEMFELKTFVEQKTWVNDKKLPISLVKGLPGAGKTCFIQLLARECKSPIVNVDLTSGRLSSDAKRLLADTVRRSEKVFVLLDYTEYWTFQQYSDLFSYLLSLYGYFGKRKSVKSYKIHPQVSQFGSHLFIVLHDYPYIYENSTSHPIYVFRHFAHQVELKVNFMKIRKLQSYLFSQYNVSMSDEFRREQKRNHEHVNLSKMMINAHWSLSVESKVETKKIVNYDMIANRAQSNYFQKCAYVMKPQNYFDNNMDYIDYINLYIDDSVLIRLVANNYIGWSFTCGSKVLEYIGLFSRWLVDMDYYMNCDAQKPYGKHNKVWLLMRLYHLLTACPGFDQINVKGLYCKIFSLDANNAQRLANQILYCVAPIHNFHMRQRLKDSSARIFSFADYIHRFYHESQHVFVHAKFFRNIKKSK